MSKQGKGTNITLVVNKMVWHSIALYQKRLKDSKGENIMKREKLFSRVFIFISFAIIVIAFLGLPLSVLAEGKNEELVEEGFEHPEFEGASEWVPAEKYKTDPPYYVIYSACFPPMGWVSQNMEEFRVEAERSTLIEKFEVKLCQDPVTQIADIEDAIAKGVDGIVLDAQQAEAMAPIMEKIYDMGIPIVVVGTYPMTKKYTAFRGIDQYDYGKIITEWLVKEMGGKGNIIVLDIVPGFRVAEIRLAAAMEVLKDYPDIKILAREYGEGSYDKGKQVVASLLQVYPEVDGILSIGGAMTAAAIDVFNEMGLPMVPMTGEANNALMKKWAKNKDKGFTSIAPYDPAWRGAYSLRALIEALQGYPIQKDLIVPTPVYYDEDVENVVEWDLPDSYWLGAIMPMEKIYEIYGVKK